MANRNAKQKYIPNSLIERVEQIAEKIRNSDYIALGFPTPPSDNEVLRQAIVLGVQRLQEQIGKVKKEIGNTTEYTQSLEYHSKKSETKKPSLDTKQQDDIKPKVKTDTDTKQNTDKTKLKDILGDFG